MHKNTPKFDRSNMKSKTPIMAGWLRPVVVQLTLTPPIATPMCYFIIIYYYLLSGECDYDRCQMPQRNWKKKSNRKRSILKEERTFERKSKQNIEDTDDKDTGMECGAVWSRNMDNEERKYKKT